MMPHSLRKSFWKIVATIFAISGSYYIASISFSGVNFYLFDAAWRICIIAVVIFCYKYHPHFSRRQYIFLALLFLFEYLLYTFYSPTISPLNMCITAILAPVAEELFFRGWVMEKIDGTKKEKILYSSLFFSLYHLKNAFLLTPFALIYQLAYALLIVGPLFAWARLRYDTIFASLLLHSGNNAIADLLTVKIFPAIMRRTND